jgi:hypothetical protein
MTSPLLRVLMLLVAMLHIASANANENDAARAAALERYLKAVPVSKMMDGTIVDMAAKLPAEQRAHFIAAMRRAIDGPRVEQITRAAMLKTFTADEMNALADFYTSAHGASAMRKFSAYMSELMPPLIVEVQRAAREIAEQQRKSRSRS